MAKSKKLTPKQKLFVEEYAKDFNGARAARDAGYAEQYADRQAHALIGNSRVAEIIEQNLEQHTERVHVDVQRIVDELVAIAFKDELDTNREATRDRLRAIELLGKYAGMFKDQIEITKKTLHATIVSRLEDMKNKK